METFKDRKDPIALVTEACDTFLNSALLHHLQYLFF